jgi:hypothetical protein
MKNRIEQQNGKIFIRNRIIKTKKYFFKNIKEAQEFLQREKKNSKTKWSNNFTPSQQIKFFEN